MKTKPVLATVVLATCAWLHSAAATACEVLMETSGFINGTQSFIDTFNLPTAGTLTISLSERDWSKKPVDGLNAFVNSGNKVLLPDFGPGTVSVEVGPGDVSLHWFSMGKGDDDRDDARYDLKVRFHPASTPVPLPGALALFASGLMLLVFMSRRRGYSPAAAA